MSLVAPLWLFGSLLGAGLYILLLVTLNHQKGETPHYSLPKVVFDFLLVLFLGWISIPFLVSTIYIIDNRTPPYWAVYITSSIVFIVSKFLKGKKYA